MLFGHSVRLPRQHFAARSVVAHSAEDMPALAGGGGRHSQPSPREAPANRTVRVYRCTMSAIPVSPPPSLATQLPVGLGELSSPVVDRPQLSRLDISETVGRLIRRNLGPAAKNLSGHLCTRHGTQPGPGWQAKRPHDRAALGSCPFGRGGRRLGMPNGRDGFHRRRHDPDAIDRTGGGGGRWPLRDDGPDDQRRDTDRSQRPSPGQSVNAAGHC